MDAFPLVRRILRVVLDQWRALRTKTTKSKTVRPFRDCQFSIIFDYGVDNIGSCIDFLYDIRTKKGELTPAAKSLSWGNDVEKKITLKEVKAFLKGAEYLYKGKGTYVNAYEQLSQGVDKITLENALSFIETITELQKAFNDTFGGSGSVFTRTQLIKYIETNNLEGELNDKVIKKWESDEAEIKSERKKRYATQPKGTDD